MSFVLIVRSKYKHRHYQIRTRSVQTDCSVPMPTSTTNPLLIPDGAQTWATHLHAMKCAILALILLSLASSIHSFSVSHARLPLRQSHLNHAGPSSFPACSRKAMLSSATLMSSVEERGSSAWSWTNPLKLPDTWWSRYLPFDRYRGNCVIAQESSVIPSNSVATADIPCNQTLQCVHGCKDGLRYFGCCAPSRRAAERLR